MADDAVSKALASAKATLAHANAAFPTADKPAAPAPKAPAAKPAPTLGDELAAKATMVGKARGALGVPRMHNGGPVPADGMYQLKAGEHVLTAPEAEKARKHALMAVGMKSLTKPASKGQPNKMDAAHKMPEKKKTTGITVRSEKNQAAKIVDKTKK
jgi:hypothetical protein